MVKPSATFTDTLPRVLFDRLEADPYINAAAILSKYAKVFSPMHAKSTWSIKQLNGLLVTPDILTGNLDILDSERREVDIASRTNLFGCNNMPKNEGALASGNTIASMQMLKNKSINATVMKGEEERGLVPISQTTMDCDSLYRDCGRRYNDGF
ncbi:hypothetical protein O3P69_010372 [Scylla paramamosain]|uniref:Uncharacterized protein n=1 Tax=Scylla paramamosain TaxID=85552 RepID=A0AAW0TS77_SCYPA